MLTENEKQKIQLEEAYRAEIQQNLEDKSPNRPWYAALWPVLNSSFMIFLLGSVVLTSITSYLDFRRQREADELQAEQRAKDAERQEDQQREAALQGYYDHVTALLLEHDLNNAEQGRTIRSILRARTRAVADKLGDRRKGELISFLYGSDLLNKIDMAEINLRPIWVLQ
ncbi:MAG: hypothetical protein AAF702_14275 [Chloroflexota bacterium]